MKDKDKSKLIAIILVIITIIVVVLSFIFDKKEETTVGKIKIVTNYSNFYTVNSCLYRTMNYIVSNDNDSLLLILSDNYKKENNIDKNNVMELFSGINENSTFVSKKMYYQKINDNVTKYYVYGIAKQNYMFEDEFVTDLDAKDMYFVVYTDTANKTFAIEPYSKNLFDSLGGDNNE